MAAKRKIEKKVEPIIVQAPKEEHSGHEHELEHDLDFHGLEDELDDDRN